MSHEKKKSQSIASARSQLEKALAGDSGAAEILTRYDRYASDLWDGLAVTYSADQLLPRLVDVIVENHQARSQTLRERDERRILEPDWFQSEKAVAPVD